MNLPYTEQAKRVVRSYGKIPAPNYPNYTQDEVWDIYYHLFQDAYHLKDWILNDDDVKIGQDKIEKNKILNEFIEKNVNMKLLQSIVTNMKHLKAERNHIKHREILLTWSEGDMGPSPAISYSISEFDLNCEEDLKMIHPRRLAVKVLVSWNKFFSENKLEGNFEMESI
ncbi:MAG: hypothetical protein WAV31_04800 [Candidatus Moraniibacteriota bacterium]